MRGAFASEHAFLLHTASGHKYSGGKDCGVASPDELRASAAASPAPADSTSSEAVALDLSGVLEDGTGVPRFGRGDRVGVLVEIRKADDAGAGSGAGAAAAAAPGKARARVSFTRNGRRLRGVGAFADLAVEDGFVPVVDAALGGRVHFVDWKEYV